MADERKPPLAEPGLPEGYQKLDEIKVIWETETAPLYSDFASVASRPSGDFSILFCALSMAPLEEAEGGKKRGRARILTSVKMNAQVFSALTKAMVDNWNLWAAAAAPSVPLLELKPRPQGESDAKS